MDTSANVITTMGIISDEVYVSKNQPYFEDLPNNSDGTKNYQILKANNHTYKVLDHTDPDNQGFNALLLQEQGTTNYVVAFRGTETDHPFDIVEDAIIGLKNNTIPTYHSMNNVFERVA